MLHLAIRCETTLAALPQGFEVVALSNCFCLIFSEYELALWGAKKRA
jgi:hypothetical protein